LLLLYLLAFAAMFWWGRYLSLVKVAVQAFMGGQPVKAAVVLPNGSQVQTPVTVRGRNGQKYRVRYEDQERELTFIRGKNSEKVLFEAKNIALIFVAYDTSGKEITARVSGEGILPHTTKDRSRLTRKMGTVMTLHFEPLDRKYGPGRDQKIEWQDKKTFDQWVNSDESGVPSHLRERLLKNSSDAAHDYPILFKAAEGGGSGKATSGGAKTDGGAKSGGGGVAQGGNRGAGSGGVVQGGGGMGGGIGGGGTVLGGKDDPIPYDVLSTRLLTPAELKGKSPKALAIMRNSIFAHHGYKFTKQFWKDYFKNVPTDKAGQELNRFEKANRDLIEKEESSRGKKWTPPS